MLFTAFTATKYLRVEILEERHEVDGILQIEAKLDVWPRQWRETCLSAAPFLHLKELLRHTKTKTRAHDWTFETARVRVAGLLHCYLNGADGCDRCRDSKSKQ